MSREYADNKIKEALALCNGNMALARKQIVLLAHDDPALLEALTRPHLDGIVAYQVERIASGRAELEKKPGDSSAAQHLKDKALKKDNFGMALLRAVAAEDVTIFGMENTVGGKRKSASKQHIDAIHKIASNRKSKS